MDTLRHIKLATFRIDSSLFSATIFMVGGGDQSGIMFSSKCIFCRIILGNLPSHIIVEDKKAIAFLDAFPLAKGHTLVIPKMHYSKIQDMSEDHQSAVFHLVHRVVGPIERAAHVDSSTIAIHNGKEAGQEIDHVHVHIVPRTVHDGAGPIHSMFMKRPLISSADMKRMATAIREEL
ncbi:MAG: HIT family protein [Nitrososphaeraceae archaeon]